MNRRQALKAAREIIENQERDLAESARLISLYKADVHDYYDCIEGTVDGKSICDWCYEQNECQLQDKGGKGCKEWMLRNQPVQTTEESGHEG